MVALVLEFNTTVTVPNGPLPSTEPLLSPSVYVVSAAALPAPNDSAIVARAASIFLRLDPIMMSSRTIRAVTNGASLHLGHARNGNLAFAYECATDPRP